MTRAHLFFKVEVELYPGESPEKVAEEIRRQMQKLYVVRTAELSSITMLED